MLYVWDNMTIVKLKQATSVIYILISQTTDGEPSWIKGYFFLQLIFSFNKISKINIFRKVESKHPEVIQGGVWLIQKAVIDHKEADEDGVVYYYVNYLYEQYNYDSVGAGTGIDVAVEKQKKRRRCIRL